MKLELPNQRNRAWTMTDMLVVIAVVLLLAAILLPVLAATNRRSSRLVCVSNVRQISKAFRVWAGDNHDQYPMSFLTATNVAAYFQVMSNQLVTPTVLICPFDREHTPAANFQSGFDDSHISYFINPDANEAYPQQIMSGDANLAVDGIPVKSGLVVFPSAAQISWTAARHGGVGNISFADGSVSQISISGLQQALELSTNGTPTPIIRLAIP